MAAKRIKRDYSPEDRKAAIDLAKGVGLSEAARRLGIPKGTVSGWCFKDRHAPPKENRPVEAEDGTSAEK